MIITEREPRPAEGVAAARVASAARPGTEVAETIPYLVVAVLAALLYRPWNPPPLSILDFSEFLPILQRSESFFERVATLSAYYGIHGRSALLTYAFIAANATLFGTAPAGWEILRFALMLGNAWLTLSLLRRLGISRAAALIGAAVLVTAFSAVGAWLRLTGEMLSMGLLLLACHLGLGYQSAPRWELRGAAFALLLGAAVLAKETIASLAPLVLLLALVHSNDGTIRPGAVNRRTCWIVSLTALVLFFLGFLVLGTAREADPAGYVKSYGTGAWDFWRGVAYLLYFGFPLPTGHARLDLLGGVIFLAIVAAGWGLRFRRLGWRSAAPQLLWLMLVIVAGVFVYMPWPRVDVFYAYPFLLGPVLLLGVGLHEIQSLRSPAAAVGPVLGALLIVLSMPAAFNNAQVQHATQRLNSLITRQLSLLPSSDTLVVGATGLAPQAWQGPGPTLRRYALATGAKLPLPPVYDLPCRVLIERLRRGELQGTVLSYHHRCGPLPGAQRSVRVQYTYFDLARLRLTTRQHQADFLMLGGGGQAARGY